METETIMIIWIILGTINTILLYYIVKYDPKNVYLGKGMFYEVGLLLIWFSFAFLIIPYFLIQYTRKYLAHKLNKFNNNLKKQIKKNKN